MRHAIGKKLSHQSYESIALLYESVRKNCDTSHNITLQIKVPLGNTSMLSILQLFN